VKNAGVGCGESSGHAKLFARGEAAAAVLSVMRRSRCQFAGSDNVEIVRILGRWQIVGPGPRPDEVAANTIPGDVAENRVTPRQVVRGQRAWDRPAPFPGEAIGDVDSGEQVFVRSVAPDVAESQAPTPQIEQPAPGDVR
jgi:hypothetical protein